MSSALYQAVEVPSRNRAPENRDVLPTHGNGATRVPLMKGAVRSHQLSAGSMLRVRSLSGTLWVTMEGAPEDHVLEAGDTVIFTGPGLLVAEGLLATNVLEQQEIAAVGVEFRR